VISDGQWLPFDELFFPSSLESISVADGNFYGVPFGISWSLSTRLQFLSDTFPPRTPIASSNSRGRLQEAKAYAFRFAARCQSLSIEAASCFRPQLATVRLCGNCYPEIRRERCARVKNCLPRTGINPANVTATVAPMDCISTNDIMDVTCRVMWIDESSSCCINDAVVIIENPPREGLYISIFLIASDCLA